MASSLMPRVRPWACCVSLSYMILDFMETDLHKIIYSKNELTDEHIQYFVYQILKGTANQPTHN